MDKQWPSVSWWDAFREQVTDDTIAAAKRVAAVEIARLARSGVTAPWCDEDIVQRLLLATSEGTRAWDPNVVTLRAHLCDKVRHAARSLRDRRRLERPEVSLDAADDEDPVWSEEALVRDGCGEEAMADVARRVEARLWRDAADDPVVLQVLRAMSEGIVGESDLAGETGLPPADVRSAVRRLRRLILGLPAALVQDVRAVLNVEVTDGAR